MPHQPDVSSSTPAPFNPIDVRRFLATERQRKYGESLDEATEQRYRARDAQNKRMKRQQQRMHPFKLQSDHLRQRDVKRARTESNSENPKRSISAPPTLSNEAAETLTLLKSASIQLQAKHSILTMPYFSAAIVAPNRTSALPSLHEILGTPSTGILMSAQRGPFSFESKFSSNSSMAQRATFHRPVISWPSETVGQNSSSASPVWNTTMYQGYETLQQPKPRYRLVPQWPIFTATQFNESGAAFVPNANSGGSL